MPAAQPKALRQRTMKTRGKHMHLADVAYAVAVGSYDVFDKMVRDSLSKDVLKLRTVRRFARKARSMRRLYASKPAADTTDHAVVESLYAERKAHRSCVDLRVSFITNTE